MVPTSGRGIPLRPLQIITDSCSDLPSLLRQKYHIATVALAYVINGTAYPDDAWAESDPKAFYDQMRQGATPTTAQATMPTFVNHFAPAVESGHDVLYIGFSSALSGTLNAAMLAKNTVRRSHPDARVEVIDSLSASLGQGLLVLEAAKQAAAGKDLTEICAWIEEHKQSFNHWFTVGDLEYLRRGGRISNFASAVGSILQVKPILRVDGTGHLVPYSKVRGRKKSLDELLRLIANRYDTSEKQTIAISHSDCEPEAQELAQRIQAELPVEDVIIHQIGPVIGSHTGPETIALFFKGTVRDQQ